MVALLIAGTLTVIAVPVYTGAIERTRVAHAISDIGGIHINGAVRKDKYLVPVNRHYDVYSMGRDGRTASPFTSTLGKDDIVLAGDGAYFGLADDF